MDTEVKTQVQTTDLTPKPGLPPALKEEVYVLFHIPAGRKQTEPKNFKHTGDLHSAINKGQNYCHLMNTRYIRVEPLISDLDAELKKRQEYA